MTTFVNKARDTAKRFVKWFFLPEATRSSARRILVAGCFLLALSLLALLVGVLTGEGFSASWIAAILGALYLVMWLGMITYERHRTLSTLLRLAASSLLLLFVILMVTRTLL